MLNVVIILGHQVYEKYGYFKGKWWHKTQDLLNIGQMGPSATRISDMVLKVKLTLGAGQQAYWPLAI